MAAWNAAFIIAGLLLIALICEAYLRLANPFIETSIPFHFVDGVGLIREPNAELRYANWRDDNFVASRVNSLGFLDREPISAERAGAGCHIAFIGDSYVEAQEVPIADKFHVRLEDMAARELPHLDIITQAYGIGVTGQINQIPFYDEYVRPLSPKLVVLVFFLNDLAENSPALYALVSGADPDRMPFMSAQRDEYGALELRPPDPEYERFLLPRLPKAWYKSEWERLVGISYFANWVDIQKGWMVDRIETILARIGARVEPDNTHITAITARSNMIAERLCCSALLYGWQSHSRPHAPVEFVFVEERLPPIFQEALEYTAFGVEQFKRRADRDGTQLAILVAHPYMGTRGDPQFDHLNVIAENYGIPVISQYDYIIRRAYNPPDVRWRYDFHWNATGHQWAAEAVLEWLKANQDVCD